MTTEKYIPLHILEEITNRFSADTIIARGGYGVVHKGVQNGNLFAVKLLLVENEQGLDDQQFKNEVGNLLRVNKHRNIVQLVGYCYETKRIYVEHNGANNFSERIYRVLCFQYFQSGSLDEHLKDKYFAPNWSTCYNIIKGVCEGLNFLHKYEPPILHLDLKPANILLDSSMEPKVADFGLSRLFTPSHTHAIETIAGSQKYMPPEFKKEGLISPKNDVFSLGVVMIDIMTGPAGYSTSNEMGDVAQLMQQLFYNWSTAIEATSKYPLDEKLQVKTCIKLAIRCVDSERDNRPSTTDILDALNKTEANIPKRQLADEVPCPTISPINTIDDILNTVRAELENVVNSNKHCNSTPRDSFNNNVKQPMDDRETTSYVDEALIIGRTEEKQKIVATICGSVTSEMIVLPIYGIGGIGKTTLAQLVFNDSQFADHSRVWVYVSQNLDVDKIGNFIISQLSKEGESHITVKQIIMNRLSKLLAGQKILIVLDDVWEKNPATLETLMFMLRLGEGSRVKIIVTARDEAIAREICRTVEPYKLEPFSDKICWKIIKQKSVFHHRVDKKKLKYIGREIATKCGGVALAAQSLGYMLKQMGHSDEWESVRDSYIWNLATSEGESSGNYKVLRSLLLSYNHMPDLLKPCFSYCAVFPKGHYIAKYDLIHQWISLGFSGSMQLCERYVTQLLGMSFLQYSKTQPSSYQWQDKDTTFFTMHDLVHDLARAILADQVNDKDNYVGDKCRYALLKNNGRPLQLTVTSIKNIKALHFLHCGALQIRGDVSSLSTGLIVLNLSECYSQKFPDWIGRLKNLRYLHAPTMDPMIPNCITELSKLNYLNLAGSHKISALPGSIGDMKGLTHLDLSGCIGIHELPRSFAELKELVHLNLSYCRCSITEIFGGFTKLQYLDLSFQFGIDANRRSLAGVIGNLKKLRYLNLSGCMRVMLSAKDEIGSLLCAISTLSNLEHLNLSQNEEILNIPESMGNLRMLRSLDLLGCIFLEKLPDSMVNMVSLKVLNVEYWVPLDESVLSLLNIVRLPHFMVHASSDDCSSNIIRLRPTNPIKLEIDKLENVKSAEEAQSIKLIKKEKIEYLAFQWTTGAGRFVEDKELMEKLVPPSSVQILRITGYISASLPAWLMGIRQYLSNLKKIFLSDIPNCNNLPPLGQLPNFKYLYLCRMNGLEEWNTEYSSGVKGVTDRLFPKLETLWVTNCAKVRTIRCLCGDPILDRVAHDVRLSSSEESSSHSGAFSSSSLTDMTVEGSMVPLNQCRLLAFRTLTFAGSSDLTASPESIQHLSFLRSLTLLDDKQPELPRWVVQLTYLHELILNQCHMESLPQSLGELSSLKKLEIYLCWSIRSLPDSIQQLTKLEHLKITGCHTLRKWCESEENMTKLAHIREKVFLDRSHV